MTCRHFILLSLGLVLTGCRPADTDTVKASGTLDMTEVHVAPTVAGRVETLEVKEGDVVKAGQKIGRLDRFAQAERDYQRAKRLVPEGGATREQMENSELALRDQQLVSPIQGIVLNRVSEPGEVVSPTTPVVVIGNPDDVYVKVYIPEKEIGRVKLNQKAQLEVDSFPDRKFEGRVTFISPKAEFTPKNVQTKEERVTQMFAVKVSVTRPEGLLKAGMPADVEILTTENP